MATAWQAWRGHRTWDNAAEDLLVAEKIDGFTQVGQKAQDSSTPEKAVFVLVILLHYSKSEMYIENSWQEVKTLLFTKEM